MPNLNVEHEIVESQAIETPFLKEVCCEDFAYYFNEGNIAMVDECPVDDIEEVRLHILTFTNQKMEIEYCPFCGEEIVLNKTEMVDEESEDGESEE